MRTKKINKKPRQRRDHNDSNATDSTDQHGVYRLPDKKSSFAIQPASLCTGAKVTIMFVRNLRLVI